MSEPVQREVVVVEDDPKLGQLLLDYLQADGLPARHIADGRQALAYVRQHAPAVIVLDLMLPGLDGIGICREVRLFSDVPIIMVTARVDEVDRLLGLEVGADDYVCKPFSPREVLARVKALLRRYEGRVVARTQPWAIDEDALRIAWKGHWLNLTMLEFRLLRLLLSRPGRVFSRAQMLDALHAELRDVSDRAIDSHIKKLRRKLEDVDPDCDCIASVYGIGYRFDWPA